MSNSHPDGDRLLQHIPYAWTVSPDVVSPHTRGAMRTVDGVRRGGAAPNEPARIALFIRRGANLIAEIERAAWEMMPGRKTATALAFADSLNVVTGDRGIIVRRWLGGGVYSQPLAELLAPSGDLDDLAREAANVLCGAASNGRLKIFVNEGRDEASPRPVVFAAIDAEPGRVLLLARLLVDSFEVEQWTDPLTEAAGNGVN